MPTTSSTPTKPPILNERQRQGTKTRSTNADWTIIGQLIPEMAGRAFLVSATAVGVRLLTAAAPQPAAFAYTRRALFVTDANKVITQVGTTGTIGTDYETDAGADINFFIDPVANVVNLMVSASYPTDWSASVNSIVVDQFQTG